MALITDAATEWSSPILLAANEVWQTRKGSVFVSTTNNPASDDGVSLHELHAIQFSGGLSVRYRKTGPGEALIVREVL